MKKSTKIIIAVIVIIVVLFLAVYLMDRKRMGADQANQTWGENISTFRLHKLLPYNWQVKLGFEQVATVQDEN